MDVFAKIVFFEIALILLQRTSSQMFKCTYENSFFANHQIKIYK